MIEGRWKYFHEVSWPTSIWWNNFYQVGYDEVFDEKYFWYWVDPIVFSKSELTNSGMIVCSVKWVGQLGSDEIIFIKLGMIIVQLRSDEKYFLVLSWPTRVGWNNFWWVGFDEIIFMKWVGQLRVDRELKSVFSWSELANFGLIKKYFEPYLTNFKLRISVVMNFLL